MVAKITYNIKDFNALVAKNLDVAFFADEYINEGGSEVNEDGSFTWEFDFSDGNTLVEKALAAFRADKRFTVELRETW